jgi:hypothetical protein
MHQPEVNSLLADNKAKISKTMTKMLKKASGNFSLPDSLAKNNIGQTVKSLEKHWQMLTK